MMLTPDPADRLHGLSVVAAAAGELLLQARKYPVAHAVHALLLQLAHIARDLRRIPLRQQEKQTLQIAGDEDVHGGREGFVKRTAPVVDAGLQKLRQHIVAVGGADEPPDGQPHLFGKIARQNVPEVSGRDDKIHRRARNDSSQPDQIGICLEIIDHLRRKPSDVDRIRGGQADSGVLRRTAGENLLHAGLGIVKIPPHRADADVAALLRDHLRLLHRRDALLRIEHQNPRPLDVAEAFERGLAGVAGGRRQDDDFLRHALLPARRGDELRQHGQGHVLKGRSRAAEQLQHIAPPDGRQRRQVGSLKLPLIGAAHQRAHILKIRQKMG